MKPRSQAEGRRLVMAKQQLKEIKKMARRMQEQISVLEERVNVLEDYPFSTLGTKTVPNNGFEIYATESGGEWFKLTNNPAEMYENLMTIIGENACQ